MNRRQKIILTEFVLVVLVTAIAVFILMNTKDLINRSEAMRAMQHLSRMVREYRQQHGAVPPETFVRNVEDDLEGAARLGNLKYRGIWVDLDSTDDEVLACSEKPYRSLFVNEGYVVLRLDGRVEWIEKDEFETLLASQQSPEEKQLQHQ